MGAALRTVAGTAGTTNSTVVFTANTAFGSAVSMIQVANTTSSNVTVSVRISPSGTLYYLANGLVLPPNTSLGLISGTLNLQNNGTIVVFASAAASVDFIISSLDYS